MKLNILKFFILILTITHCNAPKQEEIKTDTRIEDFIGNYVTADYFKREEGYDWYAVMISKLNNSEVTIEIRSRIDKKKATCTFDNAATLINKDTLASVFENKTILFVLKNDSLKITVQNQKDENILYYFCSGGATLARTYIKLNEPLDNEQLLEYNYTKYLTLQNISFSIKSTNNGSLNTLIIRPEGLEISNTKEILEIEGTVTNSEIEDLNSDGWPELLVYVTSAGSGSYGSVIGYSVNNGKSMSQIYFPSVAENSKINSGYMGHDEFAIVETKLMQRFPIYDRDDTNAEPSNKIRQVEYKLVDGEANRKFVIDKVYEFNKN